MLTINFHVEGTEDILAIRTAVEQFTDGGLFTEAGNPRDFGVDISYKRFDATGMPIEMDVSVWVADHKPKQFTDGGLDGPSKEPA